MSNENALMCQAPEEFKPIEGFENYAVSNHGRIMRIKEGPNCEVGLIKNVQYNKVTGYAHVKVSGSQGRRTMSLHRMVAEAFIPNPDGLKELDHLDRNKKNNCVENLKWCTRRENMKNMIFKKSIKRVIGYPPDGGEPMTFETIRDAADYMTKTLGEICFPQGISNTLNYSKKWKQYKGWRFIFASAAQ